MTRGDWLRWGGDYKYADPGYVWTSGDGRHWVRESEGVAGYFRRVAFGAGRTVMVGVVRSAVSVNGRNWTSGLNPESNIEDVIFVNDRFLYAALNGVATSVDGLTWTDTKSGVLNGTGLAVWDNIVVVVERWGTIRYSEDRGKTWTKAVDGNALTFMDVAAGNGLFIAFGDNGNLVTSNDARTWTKRDSGSTALLQDAAHGDGVWVVVGRGGVILKSTNGIAWNTVSSPTPRFTDIAFGSGRFVATGPQAMMVSEDGMFWRKVPDQAADSLAFGNGIFVSMSTDIRISADGLNWKAADGLNSTASDKRKSPLSQIAFGDGRFVAVGGSSALNYYSSWALTSTNGTAWTSIAVPTVGGIQRLTYANGEFIATPDSFDGREIVIGTTNVVIRQSGPTLAFGPAGAVRGADAGYVTVDGQRSPAPLVRYQTGGAYAGEKYFVFGGGFDGASFALAELWISDNGRTWRDLSYPTDRVLRAVAAGNGRLVVVGDGIILERSLDDAVLETTDLKAAAENSKLTLSWVSRRGHVYRLESSPDGVNWAALRNASTGTALSWPGTGGELAWSDAVGQTAHLFRLRVAAE